MIFNDKNTTIKNAISLIMLSLFKSLSDYIFNNENSKKDEKYEQI